MKTVLVIGAAGFVGPYLIKNLRCHNYKVVPTKLKKQKIADKSFVDLDILDNLRSETNLYLCLNSDMTVTLSSSLIFPALELRHSIFLSIHSPSLGTQLQLLTC